MTNKQHGLSLIELMIAITLGLILLTGVMQVFLSSKTVFSTQQALSRVQETGRMAIEFISRDIRMAGYMGCTSRSSAFEVINTLKNSNQFDYDFSAPLRGYTAAMVPLNTFTPAAIADTDAIVIRNAVGSGAYVTQNNNGGQVFVFDNGVTEAGACTGGGTRMGGFCDGDILAVADCNKARVFQATNVQRAGGEINLVHAASGTPGNAVVSWGGAGEKASENFGPGSEVLIASNVAYFIAPGTSGRPSLWQKANGQPLELLEGVEDLSLSYGVDTTIVQDYVPDEYRFAPAVTDWTRVVSVKVELLIASIEDGVLPEMQTYSFGGVDNIAPNPSDRRLRQVFSATVGIRSRLE